MQPTYCLKHWFRNETEARWARFFKHIYMGWVYKDGRFYFKGSVVYYPDERTWFEVREVQPTHKELLEISKQLTEPKVCGFIAWEAPTDLPYPIIKGCRNVKEGFVNFDLHRFMAYLSGARECDIYHDWYSDALFEGSTFPIHKHRYERYLPNVKHKFRKPKIPFSGTYGEIKVSKLRNL